jgi:hypothetical protein
MIDIIPLLFLIIQIFGSLLLTAGFNNTGVAGRNKALSACPILFHLYSKEIEDKSSFLFFSMLIGVLLIPVFSFISSSNHFIISLDIIYFFSLLILVLYHTFKIAQTPPER